MGNKFLKINASIDNDQTDEIVAFEREGCGFESFHRRSISPTLVTAPFLKNDAHCAFVTNESKEIK